MFENHRTFGKGKILHANESPKNFDLWRIFNYRERFISNNTQKWKWAQSTGD